MHLAGLLLRACQFPLPKIYIPEPTWSNHHQVFSSLGFPCESFKYYDHGTRDLDIESYYSTLKSAEPQSIVILHACAHNPTGCDPTKDQWREIAQLMKDRQLFPLFDAAYLGFNSGNYDEDAFAIRYFVGEMAMETGICISFAKNMGLYGKLHGHLPVSRSNGKRNLELIGNTMIGERVGCFMLATKTSEAAVNTQSMLEMLQRSEVSNPPAFGAKIASQVMGAKDLKEMWFADMVTMSGRIRSMRQALYDHLLSFGENF